LRVEDAKTWLKPDNLTGKTLKDDVWNTTFLPFGPRQLTAKLSGAFKRKVKGKKWLPSRSVKELEALAPKTNPNKNKHQTNKQTNINKQTNKQTSKQTRPDQTKPNEAKAKNQKYPKIYIDPSSLSKTEFGVVCFLAIFFGAKIQGGESFTLHHPTPAGFHAGSCTLRAS